MFTSEAACTLRKTLIMLQEILGAKGLKATVPTEFRHFDWQLLRRANACSGKSSGKRSSRQRQVRWSDLISHMFDDAWAPYHGVKKWSTEVKGRRDTGLGMGTKAYFFCLSVPQAQSWYPIFLLRNGDKLYKPSKCHQGRGMYALAPHQLNFLYSTLVHILAPMCLGPSWRAWSF